jgi:hypothetical protein
MDQVKQDCMLWYYLYTHPLFNTTLITPLPPQPQSPGDRSLRVVRFQILRSLPDLHPNPIIAKREWGDLSM